MTFCYAGNCPKYITVRWCSIFKLCYLQAQVSWRQSRLPRALELQHVLKLDWHGSVQARNLQVDSAALAKAGQPLPVQRGQVRTFGADS
jgi:hypothetical protein